ncbi:MAG: hypothetical protein AB8G22_18960 [Saprospiraceae bacterium]
MLIANPIYDAVFKYMMNDNKVAKLLLSAIIGEEILELEFRATVHSVPLKEAITVLRMDFNALVKYGDGTKQLIIIEIQKAKLHTDIMRFRRYLGQQYINPENATEIEANEQVIRKKAFPILSIYFLGHPLDYHQNIPILRIARRYVDVSTGEVLEQKEEFVESLTHDSIIIQIRALTGKRRTELEQLLSIFDQANREQDFHILNIKEEDFHKRYRPVVRRLIKAVASSELREQMHVEDDIIEEMQNYARVIDQKNQQLEEKAQELQKKDNELQKKDSTIELAVRQFAKNNFSVAQISEMLDIPTAKVEAILANL